MFDLSTRDIKFISGVEVHLQQGHGTRWYVCHCVKPSFLILSSMFTPVPPFPSLILNPIIIYVVL